MTDSPPARLLSGVARLDEILHGGFPAHRLYLIDGNPGAGKTTLALQFLLEGAKLGEKCLYVTLSETTEELGATAISHGWSLDPIDVVELVATPEELDSDNQVTMYHPSETELTNATRKVLEAVERIKPSRMVFDSLSEMRLLAQSSLRYRRQILALKQFFSGRRCTVLMLDDRTSEGPDLQLQSIAHGVISLDASSPPYGRTRRQLEVRKLRGSDFASGLHDFAISRGGIVVFPRLVAAEHGKDFDRGLVVSGVPALDNLLCGGIDRGSSTLLLGAPGSGKSTIAMQYVAAAVGRGEHAAVFAFEESRAKILARAHSMGVKFKVGQGKGEVMIRQIDPSEISPGEFATSVRESVERDDARLVVIDSLNGYLKAMPEDRYLTAQLHELLTYLGNRGVATFMVVAQSGLIGSNMQSPVEASYLADTMIMTRYFEHLGKVKKAISVVKKRTGAHEESIRELRFDGRGIHLSEPLLGLRGVLSGTPVEVGGAAVG